MTKARDLSNLANGVPNGLINLDSAEIPNLDASKITTGTFDASKIGSGTLADARISASSVSQHATSFDDNKIVNDISTLALTQASNDNRSAYNTNSQFVDIFQDATGIDTFTNSIRDTSEFVNATTYGTATNLNWGSTTTPSVYQTYRQGFASQTGSFINITDNNWHQYIDTQYWRDYTIANGNNTGGHFNSATSTPTSNSGFTDESTYAIFDFKENKFFNGTWQVGKQNGYGDMSDLRFQYSTDNSTYTNFDFSSASVNPAGSLGFFKTNTSIGGATDGIATIDGSYDGVLHFTQHSTTYFSSGNDIRNVGSFEARYIKVICLLRYSGTANSNAGFTFTPTIQPKTLNATANFTGTTITAPSSVSSMGAIITYQDNAGTNALNTDIVLELSADNGSNWSTATLSALPNFSTGIKMAKVNDLAVTAGTQLKYRLNFANQASGSKEARIRGVALQY
jgi:hypothetical protein